MGKIIDMQKNQRNINISYVKEQNTRKRLPRLKIKGMKDLAKLIGPTSGKYRLSKNQRNFQLVGRTTIAAIAAALAIGTGVTVGSSIHNNAAETQEFFQEDTLLEAAKSKLLDCAFGSNRDDIDYPDVICRFDNNGGTSFLQIISGTNDAKKVAFSYSDNLSVDKWLNSKEISSLIEQYMDVSLAKEPSQKQLEALNKALEDCEDKNFKLKNGHIVEEKQMEYDEER